MPGSFSKQITAYVSALDAAERRPDAARICGLLALILLVVSFVPDLLLVMDFSRPYQIAQFSQDEFWFMEEILRLQDALVNGNWATMRNFGSPFAYGFPFWLFAVLITLPLRGHAMLMTLFLRLVFMTMKYAAFFVIYRRILALTQKPIVSLLALILLLAVPAFVFDGKIISPEYFIMLLVAIGWSALFVPGRRAQIGAGFAFALAATVKINAAPLGLLFLAPLLTQPPKQRVQLLKWWVIGALPAVLLFLFPAQPLKEILAVGAIHHISYGPEYLLHWYSYSALEFDDMLVGGWGVDFLSWPLFFIVCGYAIYHNAGGRSKAKGRTALVARLVLATFLVTTLTCFLISLTSLLHTWFVFAPFLLLVGAGSLLLGTGRAGTAIMLLFVFLYGVNFGQRYVERWQHRVDKFESVAASEADNAEVAAWIATHCPKAREAVIDYNLVWPPAYDGPLQKMWTPVEVDDYRRINEIPSSAALLDKIDLLLPKSDRVRALMPGNHASINVTGAILGAFFPENGPTFAWQRDFSHLSVFAREGVCK